MTNPHSRFATLTLTLFVLSALETAWSQDDPAADASRVHGESVTPDPAWDRDAARHAPRDRSETIFLGVSPNKLACDTTLRPMPDGSWVMVIGKRCTLFVATHDGTFAHWKEWMTHSDDSGRTWSDLEPAPGRLHDRTFIRNHLVTRDGVLISDDRGKTWTEHGDIRLSDDDDYAGWAENNIVELDDGRIAMIIRADRLGGVLYYAESTDGGRTWPKFATPTKIPNPGSKATLYGLGGDTVALLHNPNPRARSPLALWVSFDGMQTWPYQRPLRDDLEGRFNYPDGFVSDDRKWLHFAFDHNRDKAIYVGTRLPETD